MLSGQAACVLSREAPAPWGAARLARGEAEAAGGVGGGLQGGLPARPPWPVLCEKTGL